MTIRKERKKKYRALTADEQAALVDFATKNGPYWRDKLALGWMKSQFPGTLQVIRNSFGPSWLYNVYKLPTEGT